MWKKDKVKISFSMDKISKNSYIKLLAEASVFRSDLSFHKWKILMHYSFPLTMYFFA
jgi:hypothetical protein